MMSDSNVHRAGERLILTFPEYREPARRLADHAGIPFREIELHRFPDGESRVRLPERLPEEVIICRSLDDPNHKLVELLLAAATARELGVSGLTLVAPYLCYMRQDKAFQPGEAVSQRIIGHQLAQWFDTLVTVDPHLHRVHRLGEVVPGTEALTLTAAEPIAEFIGTTYADPLLVGPDEESEQWVAAVARRQGLEYLVGRKRRHSDYSVEITLPPSACAGRDLILLDDVASTGRTLEFAAHALQACEPASLSVVVTHALFVGDALERLARAGVSRIWSTDSIPHASNAIPLTGLLAAALAPG